MAQVVQVADVNSQQVMPILLIPDILPAGFCKELTEIWKNEGSLPSHLVVENKGQTSVSYNYHRKVRRDRVVENATAIHRQICGYLVHRVVGEIKKQLDVECRRVEEIKIACYERGGYCRVHRDNRSPSTAHRQFAVSLALNDDYEGGSLRFPEYGMRAYRPPAGSAVVFHCGLLHEVTNVTAGERFVLLTFLHQ